MITCLVKIAKIMIHFLEISNCFVLLVVSFLVRFQNLCLKGFLQFCPVLVFVFSSFGDRICFSFSLVSHKGQFPLLQSGIAKWW